MDEQYKVLDLFAGAGGFSLGFKSFNVNGFHPFVVAGAVENDAYAVKTLSSAFSCSGEKEFAPAIVSGDITLRETKEKLYELCAGVDVIIGGPPCQSFSMIGPRSGCKEKQARFANDSRNDLFSHYIEIVKHYKPAFFVFENVRGISSKSDGNGMKYIDMITESFEGLGYSLTFDNEESSDKRFIILNAADYGVPQFRERVFVIGNRFGVKNPYPAKTHCEPDYAFECGLLPYVTLMDAIGDLPRVMPKITYTQRNKDLSVKDVPSEIKREIDRKNMHRQNGADPTDYHWEKFEEHFNRCGLHGRMFLEFIRPDKKNIMLTGHMARGQQESDIVLFRNMKQGMTSKQLFHSDNPEYNRLAENIKYKMDSFQDKYKKLSWNRPCGTVFAHMQKDGNRFIHPDSDQARTLTVREAARIQSFPDDYTFEAPGNVRYKYIGNAVPPLLARAIATAIYRSLSCMVNNTENLEYHGH